MFLYPPLILDLPCHSSPAFSDFLSLMSYFLVWISRLPSKRLTRNQVIQFLGKYSLLLSPTPWSAASGSKFMPRLCLAPSRLLKEGVGYLHPTPPRLLKEGVRYLHPAPSCLLKEGRVCLRKVWGTIKLIFFKNTFRMCFLTVTCQH